MITKCVKKTCLVLTAGAVIGVMAFGTDAVSYVKCSAKSIRGVVRDSVPIEFELKRAKALLDEIIPEMYANIRLIAQEEVEIAALQAALDNGVRALDEEKERIGKLSMALAVERTSYTFGNRRFNRYDLKTDLAARFDRFKEAEIVHASQERLLSTRQGTLQAALTLLDKTKSQKRLLADKISALEGKYRVVKAAASGSHITIDNSKLAQTEKLIAQIKKRLDVAERVLAHESKFVQSIPVDLIEESDLLAQIDEHFNPTMESYEPLAQAFSSTVGTPTAD
ncbi:MAG: hypothetical protein IIA65_07060 [Planctomycetes bacterium]|nr:hypothetical protein [Planctomycetota bacterium]